jgi:hypothetical protein
MAKAQKSVQTSAAGRRTAPGLVADFADLIRTIKSLSDPYRPELYYMRGPGPKWHAKHDAAPASVAVYAMPSLLRVQG